MGETSRVAILATTVLLAACAVNGGEVGDDHGLKRQGIQLQGIQQQGIQQQGIQQQGIQQQGIQQQGIQQQGIQQQGIQQQGIETGGLVWRGLRWHGQDVSDLVLVGTEFRGQVGGRALRGADLVGATVTGVGPSGEAVVARISGVQADGMDAAKETWLYGLRWEDGRGGLGQDVCGADRSGVRQAIPLLGTWDERGDHHEGKGVGQGFTFTFACTSGVLAKCVRWGYHPWQTVEGRSLAPYHQACTRMARADYCGDGTPHTREGTLIDIGDEVGVQSWVSGDKMGFEAQWTPDGAACLSRGRWHMLEVSLLWECPQKLSLGGLKDLLRPGGDGCWLQLKSPAREADAGASGPAAAVALLSNRSMTPPSLW